MVRESRFGEQSDPPPEAKSADVPLLALRMQAELTTQKQGWCASACAEDVRIQLGEFVLNGIGLRRATEIIPDGSAISCYRGGEGTNERRCDSGAEASVLAFHSPQEESSGFKPTDDVRDVSLPWKWSWCWAELVVANALGGVLAHRRELALRREPVFFVILVEDVSRIIANGGDCNPGIGALIGVFVPDRVDDSEFVLVIVIKDCIQVCLRVQLPRVCVVPEGLVEVHTEIFIAEHLLEFNAVKRERVRREAVFTKDKDLAFSF